MIMKEGIVQMKMINMMQSNATPHPPFIDKNSQIQLPLFTYLSDPSCGA